ncbi:GAF domain-containing sensor histidine kinase [Ancylobacter sp. SL191]|uniref:GAF domain-containing sensor histidine kinase n=1 Tax=Ancylobacter sp. SL191 TaxID=2995166 RepID=UPI0022712CBA|nr:GAF domain-containing sensor histidine kinase [Ancylobacter sp. SL191]WAC27634.1 GAF domain-containing sensor histidine kinase [Ancylobacter sp. SL191]
MTIDVQAGIAAIQAVSAIPAILQVVCETTGLGFAAVACVTEQRWVAGAVRDGVGFGMKPGDELPIDTTFCDRVRRSHVEVVFDDAANDPVYCNDPIPKMYGIASYISVPIVLADGRFFGTLCALDSRPAPLTTGPTVPMFRLFAQLIARHVEDQMLLVASRAELAVLHETNELREQFIAVLGHDLRSPIAAIQSGARLLQREPQSERGRALLDLFHQTTQRMARLVDDLLDLARGRLAGGLDLSRDAARPLAPTLDQVVAETRAASPDRDIRAVCTVEKPVPVDHARLAQLLSNLLNNAVIHGAADQPIEVHAELDAEGAFRLSVANGGAPIPVDVQTQLFRPYYRGRGGNNQGLGLGLYIAAQIAHAHGGTLTVTSDAAATVFTFRLPLAG